MRTRNFLLILLILTGVPAAANAVGLGVGPDVGWSVRQVALVPSGGDQVDLLSHYVSFGLVGDLELVDDVFSMRVRTALDFMEHMEINGAAQPGTFSQHGISVEGLGVVELPFTADVSGTLGVGISFSHYLPNEIRGKFADDVQGVAQQQVLKLPVVLGTKIRLEEVTIIPELGAGYGLFYDSAAPDVGPGLEDGSVQAQALDIWARVGLSFSVL